MAMNVLHYSDTDLYDGAGKAAHRLHQALRNVGVSSKMVVLHKATDDTDSDVQAVWPLPRWQGRVLKIKRRIPLFEDSLSNWPYPFDYDVKPDISDAAILSQDPRDVDVLCLHDVRRLLDIRGIVRIYDYYRRPIVWFLMDEKPYTGGCQYAWECTGYTRRCGCCPILPSKREDDRSRTVWLRKYNQLRGIPITFVASTSWLADRIRQSSLFREHRIVRMSLPLDSTVFRPFDQRAARDLLHVPQDKKVIFAGSNYVNETRKGMAYLVEALQRLVSHLGDDDSPLHREDMLLLLAGHRTKSLAESLPFQSVHLGYLKDDITLALAYQAADLFACPSIQDAGPMMINEAMLCGTPVVAFNSGGAPDWIRTMETGYVADYKDSGDLARGMQRLLSSPGISAMRVAVHDAAIRRHSPSTVAAQCIDLFQSLMARSTHA
jgi:glycosyltransferase involved in cell wall biosynthesis